MFNQQVIHYLISFVKKGSEPTSGVREEDETAKNEPIYVNVTNRKQSVPVPLSDLYDYICRNKENSCEGFKREFEVKFVAFLIFQCSWIVFYSLVFIFFVLCYNDFFLFF